MNSLAIRIAVLLVTLTCLSVTTSALNCYWCLDCPDPFNKTMFWDSTTECDSTCSKKILKDSAGNAVTQRDCGISTETGCDSASESGISLTLCQCNTGLCNTAPSTLGSLHVTALAVGLVAVYIYNRR